MRKFSKKATALIMVVMMLVVNIPSVAFADEPAVVPEMIIRMDSDYYTKGTDFTAEVWVYNANFNVAGFSVSYDKEAVKLSDENDFYNTVDFKEYSNGNGIFECVTNSLDTENGTVAAVLFVTPLASESPVVSSATNEKAKELRIGKEGFLLATIKFTAQEDVSPEMKFTTIPEHADFGKKAYVLTYKGKTLDDVKLSVEYKQTPYAHATAFAQTVELIGEITLESENQINAAYAIYEALDETAKTLAKDAKDALDVKKAEYDRLVKEKLDKEAAKKVIDGLKALEAMEPDDTGEMQAAIDNISKEYAALTDDQKAIVNQEAKAEEIISGAKERLDNYLAGVETDKKYEKAVKAMQEVADDEEITLEDKEKVNTAKALYDALSDEQKSKVDAKLVEALNAALETIKELETPDTPDVPEYTTGDVNGDGKINALDATQILRYANNKPSVIDSLSEEEAYGRGDVNGDKKINALDATQILRYANNKPSVLDTFVQDK